MTQAFILNETLSDADRAAIRALLEARGIDVVFGMPFDLEALFGTAAIGVICLPADEADNALLTARAQSFAGFGLPVIGIWLHDETDDLPVALGDFGTGVVTAGSAELDRMLAEPATAVWERPDGTRRADQPTPRNRC